MVIVHEYHILWAGWVALCHFSCLLNSILPILKATLWNQWRASRMLLYEFIPSLLCNFHKYIPFGSYATNKTSDLGHLPCPIRSWNQDYSQGLYFCFLPFNKYYFTSTTCLKIRKAFNKKEILSAYKITLSDLAFDLNWKLHDKCHP